MEEIFFTYVLYTKINDYYYLNLLFAWEQFSITEY